MYNKPIKIIGLTGFAKSGKSSAAMKLKELGGKEIAFADHLKNVCSVVFNIPRSDFDDQAVKEVPFKNSVIRISRSHLEEILKMFEIPVVHLPKAILDHEGVLMRTPRYVAQYVGTEILRAIDNNIHVDTCFKLNQNASCPFFICSDVRFENERLAIKERGGIVIGINRSSMVPKDFTTLHASEREIPFLISNSDFSLNNDGDITDFLAQIEKIAKGTF